MAMATVWPAVTMCGSGGGAEWTIKSLPDRAWLVRQAIEIGRLDHRRPIVGKVDGETGTAVGEIDQHW